MKVGITGSSGFIGIALAGALRDDGHTVVPLVRGSAEPGQVRWDPVLDPTDLDGMDAIVNLAGAGIGDHRWSAAYKRTILDSRVAGTKRLASAIAGLATQPLLVSGSAVGYYGDRGDEVLTEASAPGTGFLADVCRQWEAATDGVERVVRIRTGVVVGKGGALKRQQTLFKLGLGGRLGSGRQYLSWISIEDAVGAIRFLLHHPAGDVFNLTSPSPVTNAEFTATLAQALHRPAVLRVPAAALKVALGEMAEEMVLGGQRAMPAALQAAGYQFKQSSLVDALTEALQLNAVTT